MLANRCTTTASAIVFKVSLQTNPASNFSGLQTELYRTYHKARAKPGYNGPGAVGSKIPIIDVNTHMITATTIDLSQPILYNHFKDNNHAIPPTIAARRPLPNKKYVMP
jgi:hypothetical protein